MRPVALVAMLLTAGSAAGEPSVPVADADAWVRLVDAGRYADSWMAAGAIFKERVKEDVWVKDLEAVRQPLGTVLSRAIQSQTLTKTLPGAPDGTYAIVQFGTTFVNKASAIETVVLAREPAGWRVDGYFVK